MSLLSACSPALPLLAKWSPVFLASYARHPRGWALLPQVTRSSNSKAAQGHNGLVRDRRAEACGGAQTRGLQRVCRSWNFHRSIGLRAVRRLHSLATAHKEAAKS